MFDLGLWIEKKIFKVPQCIAIDMGSSSMKVMNMVLEKGEYRINYHAIEYIPANLVMNKEIKEPEKLGQQLRVLLDKSKNKATAAVMAIGGAGAVTRTIQLSAALTPVEIEGEVYLESPRYIPFDLEEAYFDYQVIGPSKKGKELLDVLLVAAKKNVVDNRLAFLKAAGLTPYVIDIENFALERTVKLITDHLPTVAEDQKIGLLDLGAHTMTLSVMEGGSIVYSREQNFGGKQLSDEIELRYGISSEEISVMNKVNELPEDYLLDVLEPFKNTLIQQINRALQFFYSSDQHGELAYLILFGGVAGLSNLEELVKNQTKVKTIIGNPFVQMSVGDNVNFEKLQSESNSHFFTVGLCLRAIYDNRN